MLRLGVEWGKSITFDNDIKVTVLGITNDKVQLGVVSPKQVIISKDDSTQNLYTEFDNKKQDNLVTTSELFDEELIGRILRTFGQSANDEFIPDTNIIQ